MDSIDYYNRYAGLYFENTVNLDMSEIRDHFLEYVPENGAILDLGCGSGRDSKIFLEKGYEVTAMDASEQMCDLASIHTGLDVIQLDVRKMDFSEVFDGIWACASLLHITPEELSKALGEIENALKPHGIFYMSVKKGDSNGFRNERYFADYEIPSLRDMLMKFTNMSILEVWETKDVRDSKKMKQGWINVLAKKV